MEWWPGTFNIIDIKKLKLGISLFLGNSVKCLNFA